MRKAKKNRSNYPGSRKNIFTESCPGSVEIQKVEANMRPSQRFILFLRSVPEMQPIIYINMFKKAQKRGGQRGRDFPEILNNGGQD